MHQIVTTFWTWSLMMSWVRMFSSWVRVLKVYSNPSSLTETRILSSRSFCGLVSYRSPRTRVITLLTKLSKTVSSSAPYYSTSTRRTKPHTSKGGNHLSSKRFKSMGYKWSNTWYGWSLSISIRETATPFWSASCQLSQIMNGGVHVWKHCSTAPNSSISSLSCRVRESWTFC